MTKQTNNIASVMIFFSSYGLVNKLLLRCTIASTEIVSPVLLAPKQKVFLFTCTCPYLFTRFLLKTVTIDIVFDKLIFFLQAYIYLY